MKKGLFPVIGLLVCLFAKATDRDSTIRYMLPDSVKAIQFMAEIEVNMMNTPKRFQAGIQTNLGSLYLAEYKGKRTVQFMMHEHSRIASKGQGIKDGGFGGLSFDFNWMEGKPYKLMVAMAADSTDQICLYSAYIFLPDENKWKFIGTRKHTFYRDRITEPSLFLKAHRKSTGRFTVKDVWCQRSSGSWKYLKDGNPPSPVINYFGNVDSVTQNNLENKIIKDSIATGKTDAIKTVDGIYYTMLKEGTGRQVLLTDTVIAYYKGYLFSNGQVFDQTKDKPASFPLNRLIRGWQIGVPLCRVGGKIKLVIPSALAYTIRTRSAKIPPNSILVFEIEVVEAKLVQ